MDTAINGAILETDLIRVLLEGLGSLDHLQETTMQEISTLAIEDDLLRSSILLTKVMIKGNLPRMEDIRRNTTHNRLRQTISSHITIPRDQ